MDKAAEFTNIDVDYILGWYKSIKTRFGKLSKIPSGSGAEDLTDQDAGTLSKFAFLKMHISRQWGTQLGGVSIKNQLDFKNLLLFHIHMYYCITFILSNPCFVLLYLQLAAKLATSAGPKASSEEESDGGTADVIEVLASSTMSSSPCVTNWVDQISCAEEDQVLFFPVYWWFPHHRESWRFSQGAGDNREALLEEPDIARNSRVQFEVYLTSMIPHIHDSILVDFLDESHRLLVQYVSQSDLIKLQET